MPGGKPPQIGRTAPGKMGAGNPEMIEQLREAGLDRAVLPGFSGGCDGRFPLVIRGAAVDVDRLAGDEAAIVADQEEAGGGDLVDLALAP
jgi:hypothetical protein